MNHTQDCGRHIEDLSDYLDTGASPDAEHIDHCPQCQARLAGLRSLNAAAMALLDDDVAVAAAEDSGWLDGILANLQLETRAGRSIPLAGGELEDLSETEGSVIAMVRAVGDSLGGVLIGRCRLEGDVSIPGAPVEVNINVSARYGYQLPWLAQELRDAVWAQLLVETELNVAAVNVAFTDMRPPLADGLRGTKTTESTVEGEQ
ncbi:Asp23/Gls24 family envelope stress response protein [Arthrobacter sp. HLT1-20]